MNTRKCGVWKMSVAWILVLMISVSIMPIANAANVVLSQQGFCVDGSLYPCEKYNIDGYNYFKLRTIAEVMSHRGRSQFDVGYDNASRTVKITTGKPYSSSEGYDMGPFSDKSKTAVKSSQTVQINGKNVTIDAYNIGGNNYFKLRDLGELLDFYVDYNEKDNYAVVISKPNQDKMQYIDSEQGVWVGDGSNGFAQEIVFYGDKIRMLSVGPDGKYTCLIGTVGYVYGKYPVVYELYTSGSDKSQGKGIILLVPDKDGERSRGIREITVLVGDDVRSIFGGKFKFEREATANDVTIEGSKKSAETLIPPAIGSVSEQELLQIRSYIIDAMSNEEHALLMCSSAMVASSSYYGKYYAEKAQDYYTKITNSVYKALLISKKYDSLSDVTVDLATIYGVSQYCSLYQITSTNYLSYVVEASTYSNLAFDNYDNAIKRIHAALGWS